MLIERPGLVSIPAWDAEEECAAPSPVIRTMGDFRRYTKNVPDDTPFMINAPVGVFENAVPHANGYKLYGTGELGSVEVRSDTKTKAVIVEFGPYDWY